MKTAFSNFKWTRRSKIFSGLSVLCLLASIGAFWGHKPFLKLEDGGELTVMDSARGSWTTLYYHEPFETRLERLMKGESLFRYHPQEFSIVAKSPDDIEILFIKQLMNRKGEFLGSSGDRINISILTPSGREYFSSYHRVKSASGGAILARTELIIFTFDNIPDSKLRLRLYETNLSTGIIATNEISFTPNR